MTTGIIERYFSGASWLGRLPPKHRRCFVKFTGWLIYLFCCAVFVVGSMEVYVRFFVINQNFRYFEIHPSRVPAHSLQETYQKEGITIRSGRRELLPRGAREQRVALLGDSVTFGVGVEDSANWTELLQAGQKEWDVYNYGVPGYGIVEVTNTLNGLLASRLGKKWDLVVYCYNLNDPYPAMQGHLPLLTTPANRITTFDEYQGYRGMLTLFVKDHLKSLIVLRSALRLDSANREAALVVTDVTGSALGSEDQIRRMATARAFQQTYHTFQKVYTNPLVAAEITQSLARMKAQVEQQGGQFVVTIFYDYLVMANNNQALHARVVSLIESSGVRFVDSYELCQTHCHDTAFYADPGHPGVQGNALLAGFLLDNLFQTAPKAAPRN